MSRAHRISATYGVSTCRIRTKRPYEVGQGFSDGNAGVGRVPLPGDFMAPAGYNSREGSKRILEQYKHALKPDALYGGVDAAGWDAVVESNRVVVGSPKTVIKKIREGLEIFRPGILGLWTNDGTISHRDTMRCLELMKQEVIPALHEMGNELDLPGPFEKTP